LSGVQHVLCTATTDTNGVATCPSYTGPNPPTTSRVAKDLRFNGYTATFTPAAGSNSTRSTAHATATQSDRNC
jgi:hypothetical protein